MKIRHLGPADDPEWLRMRGGLWPELSATQHRAEMAENRSSQSWATFVADRGDGRLGGFLELGERKRADGCESSPIAYVEGWYVDPDLRRTGVGRALIRAAEQHAAAAGYREIASDCVLSNQVSLVAHLAVGFEDVERLIHFRKPLARPGSNEPLL